MVKGGECKTERRYLMPVFTTHASGKPATACPGKCMQNCTWQARRIDQSAAGRIDCSGPASNANKWRQMRILEISRERRDT